MKEDNKALCAARKELITENIVVKKILKMTFCESCGGPSFPMHEHERFMQKMRMENEMLKEKIEKISTLLARYEQKEISQLEFEHTFACLNAF
ncbi:hypothetical protein MtrunA17_Chr6g0460611 [Medicago truncatula]|nr:hypothetical protein MtrunA17_Chr6g0460611 [Medicago truncatula]